MNPSDLPVIMPHGTAPMGLWGLIVSDPLMLLTLLLPLLVFAFLFAYRIWAWRRLGRVTERNTRFMDDTTARTEAQWQATQAQWAEAQAQWRESQARSDRMIALLTEIRDALRPPAPPAP